jgi:hypothetical protein
VVEEQAGCIHWGDEGMINDGSRAVDITANASRKKTACIPDIT